MKILSDTQCLKNVSLVKITQAEEIIYFIVNYILIIYINLITIRYILVVFFHISYKTKEFLFLPSDSAADITDHVYTNWPTGILNILLSCTAVFEEVPSPSS
jgi:hypothetical protein